MNKLLIYFLAYLYIAFCFYLVIRGDPNAVPFFLYAGLCLSLENERQQKFLAEKISRLSLWKIFSLNCCVVLVGASLASVLNLNIFSTVILTTLGLLTLGFSTNNRLEEMSKYCYEHAAVARTFRAVIILFPIPAFLLPTYRPLLTFQTLTLAVQGFSTKK